MDRNLNIPVATGKGPRVSIITSRSVFIVLPRLLEIPEVSLITRQES